MGLRLQRHLGKLGDIQAGQYAVDGPCLFVACPRCQGIEDISVTHTVNVGGVVVPRFTCQTATCGWQDFLTLDCWNEEPRS